MTVWKPEARISRSYRNSSSELITSTKYHIAFCPKYCREVIVDDVKDRMEDLVREVCEADDMRLISMNVEPNAVMLTLDVDPRLGIHRAVKRIKARSSNVLRDEFPRLRSRLPTLWTNSYFLTTEHDHEREMRTFIKNQKNI